MFCNVRSYHRVATYRATRNDPKVVSSHTNLRNGTKIRGFPPAAFARLTNPYLPASQLDVFQKMSVAAGLSRREPRIRADYVEYATELIIANMIVNGFSLMPYKTASAGILKGQIDPQNQWSGGAWEDEFLPGNELGFGGQAFSLTPDEERSSTRFVIKTKANGYAYSYDGMTQKGRPLRFSSSTACWPLYTFCTTCSSTQYFPAPGIRCRN